MTRTRDFIGRSFECSACGYIGPRDDAYAHAPECPSDDATFIGPRYYADRHRNGEQARLGRWSG